ncbi:hypothetical protein TNIN_415541 [Trichonephila inaurata madagascariensis]|uniref:Uncharacterized protein n=1 Tax=Trichonephila inaurata madagascariensis TaxID=2747483 RepID=A0A8X6YM90_9ARAC|nr:hypothetical protein TNIN_415541 [Trichonephila inaurata madagascariensis]
MKVSDSDNTEGGMEDLLRGSATTSKKSTVFMLKIPGLQGIWGGSLREEKWHVCWVFPFLNRSLSGWDCPQMSATLT